MKNVLSRDIIANLACAADESRKRSVPCPCRNIAEVRSPNSHPGPCLNRAPQVKISTSTSNWAQERAGRGRNSHKMGDTLMYSSNSRQRGLHKFSHIIPLHLLYHPCVFASIHTHKCTYLNIFFKITIKHP